MVEGDELLAFHDKKPIGMNDVAKVSETLPFENNEVYFGKRSEKRDKLLICRFITDIEDQLLLSC